MLVQSFPSGPFLTNAIVVACPNTKAAAIIDPAPESAAAVTKFIDSHQLKVERILLTHSHWDHTGDVARLKEQYGVPVHIHKADAPNLEHPGTDGLPLMLSITGVKPDHFLEEGDVVEVGTLRFEVIHTPGHSPGGVCFYEAATGNLISGDTLFKGSIGNLSLPTSEPDRMWPSLDKLAKLPPETRVYPGHGEPTTLAEEPWLPDAKSLFGFE